MKKNYKNNFFKKLIVTVVFLFIANLGFTEPQKKLRIGISLHPYYSFVKNIVGDKADVIPLISSSADSHGYTPQAEDIKRAATLDCIVVNGIGHDEFAFQILKAAGMENKIPYIYANEGVALIPVSGYDSVERIVNPHTFISISTSIQQIYTISKKLQTLDPKNAKEYKKNTFKYVKKLKKIKAMYMKKLASIETVNFSCATVHGGYDYLLQEFGLRVVAVIEPAHGTKPTASQLRETIEKIKKLKVAVLFSEAHFKDAFADTIAEETGILLSSLSHLTSGAYTTNNFEKGIISNLENLTNALIEVSKKKR